MGLVFPARDAVAFKMESGAFRINATTGGGASFTSQSFQQTYDTVPVVFILTTNQGGDISVVRIRNVTTTGFEAVMVEDPSENGPHIAMDVHYFAIEPGVHTMTVDDELLGSRTITIDAGVLSTSNIVCGAPAICAGTYTTQMTTVFANTPVVLAQLQTFVNGIAGAPPATPQPWITASVNNVLTDRFDVAIDRHEVNLGSLTPAEAALEQIGYVVFDSDLTAADFTANNAAAVLVELETIRVDPPLPPAADGWNDGCDENINFSKSLPSRLVVATKQTRLESDGGWLRRCNLTSTRVRVVVDEDGVGDAERSKALRDGVGVVVFSRDFFFDSTFVPLTASTSFKIEADEITLVPGTPLTVTLRQFYEQAPAVFLLIDSSNTEPTAVRVTDVTTDLVAGTTSFTAVAIEPQGGAFPSNPGGAASSVHYIAVEKGLFNFPDGTLVDVGDVSVTALQQNFAGADSFQTVTFNTAFPSPPVVLAQIIGVANTPADPAVPWLTVAYATNSTSISDFRMALERSEVNAGGPIALPETVAYLAIEPGLIGSFLDNSGNAIRGEAQRSFLNGLALSGWDDICFNAGVLGIPFLDLTYSIPPLVVAHEMSHIGGDGGWHRRCNLTTSHVRIAEDEDQFANAERAHIWEETGLVAFSEAFDADFSLFAFYEMEEPVWNNGAAGQVDNTVDTVLDGTPIDNALTAVTTPAFTALPESTCRYGSFDGSGDLGAVSDGVEIGTTDLALVDEMTVSAWVRWAVNPPAGNNRAVYVQNDTPTNFNDYQFALRGNANNRRFEFRVQTVSGSQRTQTANIVSVNTWYHVTGVYDGSEVRIYVDDVLQDTAAHSGDFVTFNSNRVLNIGKSANAAANEHGIDGLIDEVRLYRRALSLDEIRTIRRFTRPCSSGHDHYAIDHAGAGGGFGVTCEAEAVTILSHEVSHVNAAPPAGTVMTITATPGDGWALGSIGNPGSFSDLGGGVAQYIFDGIETQIELLLSQTSPAVVSFGITDTLGRGIGVGEGPTLEFRDVILQFSPVGVQVAGKPETFSVQVIETGGSGACQAAIPAPGTVDFAFECFAPNTNCTGVTNGEIDGIPISAFDQGAAVPADPVALTFDATSTATFQAQYNDAGLVSLKGSAMVGTPPATVEGATNQYAVRPFALYVDVPGNPAAYDASDPNVFTRAGEDFEVQATPVRWDASDDLDLDGIADGHESGENNPSTLADLSDNSVTVNYQTSGMVPDGRALLSSYLHRPSDASASDPGLSDTGPTPLRIGPFAGTTASSPMINFDEVGVIEIEAVQTGDYLSIGGAETAKIRGVSGAVGRFIPAYFEVVATPNFDLRNGLAAQPWTCGFTYIGQPFEYLAPPVLTVAAKTALNTDANNYSADASAGENFFKFTSTFPNRSYVDNTAPSPSAAFALETLPGAATLSGTGDFDGVFDVSLNGESFRYDKGAAAEIEFEPVLELTIPAAEFTDSDGVCHPGVMTICNLNGPDTSAPYVKSDITTLGVEQRFGRLVVASATGSELIALPVPMQVEYFADQGGGIGVFVTNIDDAPTPVTDTCTELNLQNAVRLTGSGGEQNGDAASVPLQGTGGTTRLVDPASGLPPAPDPEFDSGATTLLFQAPTPSGNTGFVDIRIDLSADGMEWLRYDWDGDGNFDDDPTARASFGIFPGRREIIYIREPWD